MTTAVFEPHVTPSDRLGMTICVAIIVHTMIVMGVSFSPEPAPESNYESLEVVLVSQRSEKPPEDADMLAQANLQGGGDGETQHRPAAPVESPMPAPIPEVAATAAAPSEAAPVAATENNADVSGSPNQQEIAESSVNPVADQLVQEVKGASNPVPKPAEAHDQPLEKVVAEKAESEPKPKIDPTPLPSAAQLLTRSFALASVSAELDQKLEMRAKRPRRKFVSANTKEYRYAAYMEAWRAKVERVGNLNYPDEARRKNLSGALLLDVALNPDGSVREINVRRSSGHKSLDDAAIRIVELAAPFARFPPDILKEVDILHVTRTWKFLNSAKFSSR
ncbi:MAG: energy transducer TonB [Gammaproteobacteria bacterium]